MTVRLRDERGGILAIVAVALPVLLALTMFVVEVGNWYAHKRHLQTQADAAALAGAGSWDACFDGTGAGPVFTAASAYAGAAGAYGGTTYGAALHNLQLGGANRGEISVVYQSATYAGQTRGDDFPDGASPCESPYVFDVKATESDLPFLLPGAVLDLLSVPAINAHSRVQLFRVTEGRPGLPLAIPVPDPNQAPTVALVDEATGAQLARFTAATRSSSAGVTTWTGSATVDVPAARIGIRVDGGAASLVTLRGFAAGGSGSSTSPLLREVWPITCSGSPFFSELDALGTTCASGVGAVVDFGASADPALEKVRATVTSSSGGNLVATLERQPGGWWRTPDPLPFPLQINTGRHDVLLDWKYGNGPWAPFAAGRPVHAIYAADATSKAVARVAVVEQPRAGNTGAPYALPAGTRTLTVAVSLQALSLDRMTALRLTGGSRTTAIACDGTGTSDFTASLLTGCRTPYQVNVPPVVCPETPPSGPADCVPLKTGNLGNTVAKALNERFAGCPAVAWPNYEDDDPRIVQLLLTDFSAVDGSGATEVPVTAFARFYLVGWSGSACAGSSWPFPYAEPSGGNLWGYFVKQVDGSTAAGTEVCTGDALDPCAPALIR